jgi:uncharacterized cupredoxin-like copper-binding protein
MAPTPFSARRLLGGAIAGGLAVAGLAACGSSDSSSPSSTATSSAATSTTAAAPAAAGSGSRATLNADAGGALSFNTTKLTVQAGAVTVAMSNPAGSGVPHGIALSGNGVNRAGAVVQPGATSTLKLALKPGTYTFFCPVPGHEAAGMKGTLVAR